MSPIVSPWWFYLFDLVESLGMTASAIAVLSAAGVIVVTIISFADDENIFKKIPKFIKVISIIAIIVATFLPSKETCYQMAAASLMTPDNISIMGETAKDAIDYIVESVDKVLDKED